MSATCPILYAGSRVSVNDRTTTIWVKEGRKDNESEDVRNLHAPLHRMQPCHELHLVLSKLGPQSRRIDRAGHDAVNRDTPRGELLGECSRELLDGTACGADEDVRG